MQLELTRKGVAELVGTFCLVFIGAGAGVYGDGLETALAHGLVIFVMVSAFAGISGGHFNPAVTFGLFVTRRIAVPLAVFYWAVQLIGATLAALLLKQVFPVAPASNPQLAQQLAGYHLGAPSVSTLIDPGKAVTIEAVGTFFLVLVVFATAVDPKGAFDKIAGLAIGMTIAFGVMMAGPLTGGMLNPARAFGPQLVSDHWTNWWVWYVGPLAGGALAAVLYEVVYLMGADHGEGDEAEDAPPAGAEPATDAPA
jgi:MIP family channel proteins